MTDKATNKPKGYAFCEYRDFDTAMSAMRNLTGKLYGGRPLRIDWADHEMKTQEGLSRVIERQLAEAGAAGVAAVTSERADKMIQEKLMKHGKVSEEQVIEGENTLGPSFRLHLSHSFRV